MTRKYPEDLIPLIAHLKKLPGVGTRTAERFAFELLGWPKEELSTFGENLKQIQDKIPPCTICGCLTNLGSCPFCEATSRDHTQLCIIASAKDAFAIEDTKSYRGLYHVVEHLLSPLDGRHAHQIRMERILERISKNLVGEIILAFDSTLEGDTTALYIKNQLGTFPLSISRLAFGLPMGSSLEYINESTLLRAFKGRQSF